jgi:hypothetical protein
MQVVKIGTDFWKVGNVCLFLTDGKYQVFDGCHVTEYYNSFDKAVSSIRDKMVNI